MPTANKNRGKIISFIIALVLFIIGNFIQRHYEKQQGTIEGLMADVEKKQEQFLKNTLLAKAQFSEGQLFITLGLMTADAMHPAENVFIPIQQNMTQGMDLLNLTTPPSTQPDNQQQIDNVKSAFTTSIQQTGDISGPFTEAVALFNKLAGQAAVHEQTLADQLKTYRADKQKLQSASNIILWINTIILLIQLFFSSFYEMITEKKEAA
ncbi:MAG TPA: hypothetical protein VLL95_08735 [Phnomibacter sp.]|nr:hypothetical protein [Phnomibacter sp.]